MPGTIELFNGNTTSDPRLDRVPQLDPASRNYTIRELLAAHERTVASKRRHIITGATLDQGQTGGCTGFSITHGQMATPFRVKNLSNDTARDWYYANQKNDGDTGGEWPGATPQRAGSTVLASMKTLTALGLITQYRWIGAGSGTVMDDLRDTLKYVGPVHLGVNWYESMFTPDPSGLLTIDTATAIAGGHAFCVHDWVAKKLPGQPARAEYVVMQNSWSPQWGASYKSKGGFAYIPVDQLAALLAEDGSEGAVPIK